MQSHRRPAPSSEEAAIHLEVLASPWSGSRSHGWAVLLLVGLVVAAVIGVVVDRTVVSQAPSAGRAELQRILDGLVTGPDRTAPIVAAAAAPTSAAALALPTRPTS
jgi:hypothetical protein